MGGVLLAQHFGYSQLAYRLLWPVALGTPAMAGLLLWLQGLRAVALWRRVQVLRRASKWQRFK